MTHAETLTELGYTVLHLNLKRKWFFKISSGRKRYEFREAKPYWDKRLQGKTFDRIIFKNGYGKNAPEMTVECTGITKRKYRGDYYYVIALGRITHRWETKVITQLVGFVIVKVLMCLMADMIKPQ